MKKFLFTIMLSLFTVFGYGQLIGHKNWTVENPGEWGSFYWAVTRSAYADSHGKYYYYVYFFSNSYFNTKSDGRTYDEASTYIKGVKIYMYENRKYRNSLTLFNTVVVDIPGRTCDWVYDQRAYGAWFYSTSPYNTFKITFQRASAFDYSIYR
jgi:hypothetical protein